MENQEDTQFNLFCLPYRITKKTKDRFVEVMVGDPTYPNGWRTVGTVDVRSTPVILAMAVKMQELEKAAGAYETAKADRNAICEIGRIFIRSGKDDYSADAVLRAVQEPLDALRDLVQRVVNNQKEVSRAEPPPSCDCVDPADPHPLCAFHRNDAQNPL